MKIPNQAGMCQVPNCSPRGSEYLSYLGYRICLKCWLKECDDTKKRFNLKKIFGLEGTM